MSGVPSNMQRVVLLSDSESLEWFVRKCKVSLVLGTHFPTRPDFKPAGRRSLAEFGSLLDIAVANLTHVKALARTSRTEPTLFLFSHGTVIAAEAPDGRLGIEKFAESLLLFADMQAYESREAGRFAQRVAMFRDEIRQRIATPISSARAPKQKDPHEVLGVRPGMTREALKEARTRRLKECHPDKFTHASERIRRVAEAEAKDINAAYDLLTK